jgi:hypothetical protein
MVDDLGTKVEVVSLLNSFVQGWNRFPDALNEEEKDRQLNRRDKLIQWMDLPPFRVTDEPAFEDWVDTAAAKAKKFRVCPEIFHEAWQGACGDIVGVIVARAAGDTHEGIVDSVAKELFSNTRYLRALEEELFLGRRQQSILEAKHWLRH